MLLLRQSFMGNLRHPDAKRFEKPLRCRGPVAPLPAANAFVAAEHRDLAAGQTLDLRERLRWVKPIKDLGLIALEVLGGLYSVKPRTGVELPVEPEAFANPEPGHAATDADAEVTLG